MGSDRALIISMINGVSALAVVATIEYVLCTAALLDTLTIIFEAKPKRT